jgi:hypothetical protein
MVAQYNWLADVKIGFDGDPARFPTSHQKHCKGFPYLIAALAQI